MSDLDRPEHSPSKTPRVDGAEYLIYSDENEPIKYVLSSFAKDLEMELNQALADLKTSRLMEPGNASAVTAASNAIPTLETTPAPKAGDIKTRVSEEDSVGGVAKARPQFIQPTIKPQGVGESVEYTDHQILFNKGERAHHLTILLEGSVEIFDPVGNIRLAVLSAGSSFGEQAVLEGGIRDASVRALGDIKCLEIKTEALREQLNKDNGLLRQTIEGLLLQLSMCNQVSKLIATPDANLVYELLGDERLTSIQIHNKLNDAYSHPDLHGLTAEQMMCLKLQSSEKLTSHWLQSGTVLGSPYDDHLGSAYVIVEGYVEATCGKRTIRLGYGSVMGLAEGITDAPFSWSLVAKENLTVKTLPIDKVLRSIERSNPGIKGIVRYTTSRILELQKTFRG
ncbi:MAG: cyclic nucleotide-binding domain-containing protein [bacterium]|jgi:CRP-like cAMP-binding protein